MTRRWGAAPLILPLVLALFSARAPATSAREADPNDDIASARLLVETTPGAKITWGPGTGVESLSSPTSLSVPAGVVEVKISRSGFLSRTERVRLEPRETRTLFAPLPAKTRTGALARACLVPGWGSRYMERRKTAWALLALAAGSAASSALYDAQLQDRTDRFDAKYDEYLSAVTPDEIDARFRESQAAFEDADSARKNRNASLAVLAGAYLLSAAEAIFRFPFGAGADDTPGALGIGAGAATGPLAALEPGDAGRGGALRLTLFRIPRAPAPR